MINTDVKAALINYHQIKNAIQIDLQNLEVIRNKKIKLGGSIVKFSKRNQKREQHLIELMEVEERYLLELTNHQYWLKIVDDFIGFCKDDEKQIILDLYINKKKIEVISYIYSYSKSQIHRKINDKINKFVSIMNE